MANRSATRSPLATIVPTISCPGIRGSFGCVSSPSTMCRSVRQTAQAWTCSRISSDPQTGMARSCNSSGIPAAFRTMAFMMNFSQLVGSVMTQYINKHVCLPNLKTRMKKIDIYNHIWPQPFFAKVMATAPNPANMTRRVKAVPMITDLDVRFRVMDMFDDYCQILSLASPPLEMLVPGENVNDLARLANDSMAVLVQKYPDRFPGFIATLALTDPEASVQEAKRA